MAQRNLIAYNDFAQYKALPESLESDQRLVTAIYNAQQGNLRTLLGDALYTAMLANRTQQIYLDLLNGTDYTNSNGDTVHFDGVKPCLVWWAYGEYIRDSKVAVTKSGLKVNVSAESETPDKEALVEEMQTANNYAAMYALRVIDFLQQNNSDYPLYYSPSAALPSAGNRLAALYQPPFNTHYR